MGSLPATMSGILSKEELGSIRSSLDQLSMHNITITSAIRPKKHWLINKISELQPKTKNTIQELQVIDSSTMKILFLAIRELELETFQLMEKIVSQPNTFIVGEEIFDKAKDFVYFNIILSILMLDWFLISFLCLKY